MPSLRRSRRPKLRTVSLRGAGVVAALLAVALVAPTAAAATPVTNGFRDHAYGGGAARPSSDKPQSKLWFTDGTWFAGMFRYKTSPGPISSHRIFRLNASNDWVDTGVVVDERDNSHGDYLWVEGSQTLFAASVGAVQATTGAGIVVSRFSYDAATNTYTKVSGTSISGTGTGAHTVSIARDTSGRLWVAWPSGTQVLYSTSTDDGATWSAPAQVPGQTTNSIRGGSYNNSDTATVIAFGSEVAVAWSDHDDLPTKNANGFYFAPIAAGADPALPESWGTVELLPSSIAASDGERADNHLNLKTTSDGTVYGVGKTGKDTANCATNKAQPLIEGFRRTTGGTWSVRTVATVGDCLTRPQIVLSEQAGVAWVLASTQNGGAVYLKSAPLSGPDALVFRDGTDTLSQPGIPFIRSATETRIDDVSTTKQSLTAGSGLVAIANNVPNSAGGGGKFYLHNRRSVVASDTTHPTGTVTIAGGASFTTAQTVSVAVPATDAGSGLSLVRLSNSSSTSGGVLNGAGSKSYTYTTPIDWTLTGGDGTKTVYAQWRDAAGNWSTPVSDTIGVDTAAPTGTVSINGGDGVTNFLSVTLSLTGNDGSGSGVASVLIANRADFVGGVTRPFAASIPWTLTDEGGEGTKTVYVKFVDGVGNTSASAVSDTIEFDKLDTVKPTAPGAPVHKLGGTVTTAIPVRLSWAAGTDDDSGVLGYVVQRSVDGGAYTTIATPTSPSLTVNLKSSTKYRFRVATRDRAGNTSAFVRGLSFTTANYSEANKKVRYNGTWKNTSSTKYLGGKARYATARNASATLTFTGKQISWVGLTGPTSGTARVYINGTLVKSVNLNAAKNTTKKLVFTRTWSTSAKRTIRIVVRGTAGHPRVTIDSFFVLN